MNDQANTEEKSEPRDDQHVESQVESKEPSQEQPSDQKGSVLVVGVQHRTAGDIYNFITSDKELERGQHVVVEGDHGESVATVIVPPHEIPSKEVPKNAKKVVRIATGQDVENLIKSREEACEFFDMCEQKILDHNLPMKLIDTEIVEGGKKVIFFFFAEQRVDFRALVKDLASALHRYIEMRQIGARDASSFVGCMGPCGRTTCCSSYLREFQSISISMAKNQGLSPNPAKLTGMCGKLKCCLAYENRSYSNLKKGLPKQNSWVDTPKGEGKVVKLDVLKQNCYVRLESGGELKCPCRDCKPMDAKKQQQKREQTSKHPSKKKKESDKDQASKSGEDDG